MVHFAFPFQSCCVLVSVLKNEEQFCIIGYSALNQRTSERKLMLNRSYGRMIPCGLVHFAVRYLFWHDKLMYLSLLWMCVQTPQFYEDTM